MRKGGREREKNRLRSRRRKIRRKNERLKEQGKERKRGREKERTRYTEETQGQRGAECVQKNMPENSSSRDDQHEKLLRIQRVPNPFTENQRILTTAHSNVYKWETHFSTELMVQFKQKGVYAPRSQEAFWAECYFGNPRENQWWSPTSMQDNVQKNTSCRTGKKIVETKNYQGPKKLIHSMAPHRFSC